ncbi:MAG TPA: hypothetical protein O0W96_00730 [Methanocorpusculum sp.]|nr:hypothetical protein [Methanocorpusculum sp.]
MFPEAADGNSTVKPGVKSLVKPVAGETKPASRAYRRVHKMRLIQLWKVRAASTWQRPATSIRTKRAADSRLYDT